MNETVRGTLKGYDALMNLVLDEVQETLRGQYYSAPLFSSSAVTTEQQQAVNLLDMAVQN